MSTANIHADFRFATCHMSQHIAIVIILCKRCEPVENMWSERERDGKAIREEKYARKKMLIIRLTKDIKA